MSLKFWFSVFSLYLISISAQAAGLGIPVIKQRQYVTCGIDSEYKSLAYKQDNLWRGFDADICRAVATAVLDNPESFKLIPVKKENIGKALNSGQIDLMLGHHSLTPREEARFFVLPVDILYFDRQIFAARRHKEAASMRDFSGVKTCVLRESPAASHLNEYNQKFALGFKLLEMPSLASAKEAFYLNRCELISGDEIFVRDIVVGLRANEAAEILPEEIATLPVKAYSAGTNPSFNITLRSIINALKQAYAADITEQNISAFGASKNASVQNLLGIYPDAWQKLGLEPQWVKKYIQTYGNYHQILERNLGAKSSLPLNIKQNDLIENGGLSSYIPFF